MTLLAHAGHWVVQAAYFLPVLGFLGWLGWTTLKDRRAARRERSENRAGPENREGGSSVE